MTGLADEPVLTIGDDDASWNNHCPKCGASPRMECTSLSYGYCIGGIHAERADKAIAEMANIEAAEALHRIEKDEANGLAPIAEAMAASHKRGSKKWMNRSKKEGSK